MVHWGNTAKIQTLGVNVVNPKLKVFFVNCKMQIQKTQKKKKKKEKKKSKTKTSLIKQEIQRQVYYIHSEEVKPDHVRNNMPNIDMTECGSNQCVKSSTSKIV
jgi:hypothetical protein